LAGGVDDKGRDMAGAFDHVPINQAIAALAAGQHGLFTIDQLRELGLSTSAVNKRATSNRLHRVHRGVYALVPPLLLTREGRWMAAVLACGPDAVLSHRSAAALHDLRHWDGTKIEVTVPGRTRRTHPGLLVHTSTTLSAKDATVVNNIPCTTIARTQLDMAEVVPRRVVERILDQADAMQLFDLLALRDQLARNPTRRGAKILESVLAEHYVGSTLTDSEFEEEMLAGLREAGLPQPQVQRWILLDDGGPPLRADFLWRQQRLVVETDGRLVHGTWQARERDPDRDQRLTIARWRPIRVTRRQFERHRQTVIARIARLLAMGPPGSDRADTQ
jgi:very-short-patch-repair endonuclease